MVSAKFHKIVMNTFIREEQNGSAYQTGTECSACAAAGEENLIRQFTACAHTAQDPQLRTFFEQIAARHRLHWDSLAALLNAGEG